MALNENVIAWNLPNWLTVSLMGLIGFAVIGAFAKWYQSRQAS